MSGKLLGGVEGWDLYKHEDPIALTVYVKGLMNDLDIYVIHVISRATWLPCQEPMLLTGR